MNTKRTLSAVAAAALLAATATAAVPAGAQAPAMARGCTPAWHLVQAPPFPGSGLGPPAVVSRSNAWFPSDADTGPLPASHAGMLRWNGKSVAAAPEPATVSLMQKSTEQASFDSSNDGWVWGILGNAVRQQYLAHWDGHRWTMMPFAGPQDHATVTGHIVNLAAVAGVSPTDAWAVGAVDIGTDGNGNGAIIEHWDGSAWSVVPNPASGASSGSALAGLKVISPASVYAVGRQRDSAGTVVPLVEHWNGSAWRILPVPAGTSPSALFAVSASGANDLWVAGDQLRPGTTSTANPLIEHWNGTAWQVASPLPDLGPNGARAIGIYAASATDVWATIFTLDPAAPKAFLHWDGTKWTTVPEPGPQELGLIYQYNGIAGSGPDDVWASGVRESASTGLSTLLAHLTCG